jgi:hypothetical protein
MKLVPFQASPDQIRREKFNDKEHVVIPAVALVEGVIQCAVCPDPEFVSAREFGKAVESWNGRPVTINHPKRGGLFVSANSPEVLESEKVGLWFNTKVEDRRLKTEIWVDPDLIAESSYPDFIKDAEDGKKIELSTGYFADVVPQVGEFDGKKFLGVQKDLKPDHLAILTEMEGACNWEMGCGAPRINCDKADSCTECPCKLKLETDDKLADRIDKRVNGLRININYAEIFNAKDISDKDLRTAIAVELAKSEDFFFIDAVFDDFVVFERGFSFNLIKKGYKLDESNNIVLEEGEEEVRPVTSFVTINEEPDDMNKEEKVNALIANERTKFKEEDKDFLMDLEEHQLDLLEPNEVEPEPPQDPPQDPPEGPEGDIIPTPEQFLEDAPSEIQEVLLEGLRMTRERRSNLTSGIIANEKNDFTEEELKALSIEQLEKLAKLSSVPDPDYSGRGAPRTVVNEGGNYAPPAPVAFPPKGTEAA